MSPSLTERLRARIAQDGPISLAEFMNIALFDARAGYYARRPGLGSAHATGDFVTAPEISQMFGELLGAWAIETWRSLGAPAHFQLIEVGPGRGTLMADLMRAARRRPEFLNAARIVLVEKSPALRAIQAETLTGSAIEWAETLEAALAPAPLIVIANEFLDCLPIRQWRLTGGGWRERRVGPGQDGGLAFCEIPGEPDLPPPADLVWREGDVYETRAGDRALLAALAPALRAQEGAALFIDYGKAASGPGDSFQAIRRHERAAPLAEPGTADLTAWVDFAALARWASALGLGVHGPVPQGLFLGRLGIEARAARLIQAAPEHAGTIAQALNRLTQAHQMGALFKVLALTDPQRPPPPGF